VVKGVKKSFAEEIDTSSMSPTGRTTVAVLGQVGYIARGLAVSVVGGLLGYAALILDAQQAKGLDGAMRTILEQRLRVGSASVCAARTSPPRVDRILFI
jgi:hypothetical protein